MNDSPLAPENHDVPDDRSDLSEAFPGLWLVKMPRDDPNHLVLDGEPLCGGIAPTYATRKLATGGEATPIASWWRARLQTRNTTLCGHCVTKLESIVGKVDLDDRDYEGLEAACDDVGTDEVLIVSSGGRERHAVDWTAYDYERKTGFVAVTPDGEEENVLPEAVEYVHPVPDDR